MPLRSSPLEFVCLSWSLMSPGLGGVGGSSNSGLRPPCLRLHSIVSLSVGWGVSCACVSRTSGITAVAPWGTSPSWSLDARLSASIPVVTCSGGSWRGTVVGHLGPVVADWVRFLQEGSDGDVLTAVAPDILEEGRPLLPDSLGVL